MERHEASPDTPQPGEREAAEEMERPTWLLDEIQRRRPHDLRTLATSGALQILADWIAELEQQARDDADAYMIVHMDGHAQGTERARERIATLTRELAEAERALANQAQELVRLRTSRTERERHLERRLAEAWAEVATLRSAFRHTHVGPDERCAQCGLDIRNGVHFYPRLGDLASRAGVRV